MSELIITCCDYCNKNQSVTTYHGRGYVYVPEEDAIKLFGWVRDESGKIMCLDCQDERECNKDGG